MDFFNVVNPRDTYAEKMLREASVNCPENRSPKSNLAMNRIRSENSLAQSGITTKFQVGTRKRY